MAAVYINPESGNNGNSGANDANAWANFANLATQPWSEAYVKCDTIMTITTRTILSALSNKTIGNYGSGVRPLIQSYRSFSATNWDGITPANPITAMNQWYEVSPADCQTAQAGTGLWRLNTNAYWDKCTFVNFGILGNYGTQGNFWELQSDEVTIIINPANVPNADKEYAVEPVGVEMIIPSARYELRYSSFT